MGGMGMGGGPQGFDASAAFKHERYVFDALLFDSYTTNRSLLSIHKQQFLGDQAEKDLLGSRHPLAKSDDVTSILDLAAYVLDLF